MPAEESIIFSSEDILLFKCCVSNKISAKTVQVVMYIGFRYN